MLVEIEEYGRSIDRIPQFAQMRRPRIQFPSSNDSVGTRRATQKWPLICVRIRVLPHSPRATPFLAGTTTFDYGRKKFQTTETSGERALLAKCRHRGHESREGDLERDTSQGRIWLRQHSSDNDRGTFSPFRWHIPGSCVIRTRWPTNPITLSSG